MQQPNGSQLSPARPPLSRATSTFSGTKGIVVFSGGSAANSLVDVFDEIRKANHSTLSYVIPISDNGGSSSEVIRVFGGPGTSASTRHQNHKEIIFLTAVPGIGDVRSRLVRLIPEDNEEARAIRTFFNHRLPRAYGPARAEWLDIVEATHPLWKDISVPKKELIRSFLNSMNLEIVKRQKPTSRFDFTGASIGNLFLTG